VELLHNIIVDLSQKDDAFGELKSASKSGTHARQADTRPGSRDRYNYGDGLFRC
jgi:hypothetical protein